MADPGDPYPSGFPGASCPPQRHIVDELLLRVARVGSPTPGPERDLRLLAVDSDITERYDRVAVGDLAIAWHPILAHSRLTNGSDRSSHQAGQSLELLGRPGYDSLAILAHRIGQHGYVNQVIPTADRIHENPGCRKLYLLDVTQPGVR